MILINLLPQEYREKRRTPFKMMAAVAVCATINATLLAYLAWTAFGVSAEVKSELAVLNDAMQSLRPQIEYHDTLEKESKLFESREKTLKDVTGKRISWTAKIDQLIDLIHEGGSADEEYLIWLDGLEVDTEINDRKKTYGQMKATGNSGSENFSALATFLDDVQASPLSRDFSHPANPEVPTKKVEPELVPSVVWTFPFELDLKSPEDRAAAAAAAAGASAAATPGVDAKKPAAEAKKPTKKSPSTTQEKSK
jgi:Tfp pilus assembly protein PilN